MYAQDEIEIKIKKIYNKIFSRDFNQDVIYLDDIEEWDSLSHINLIIELESEFNVDIDPDTITLLYSNSKVIEDFLKEKLK